MARYILLLTIAIVLPTHATAQTTLLVSPDEQVVPLKPGDHVRAIIRAPGRAPAAIDPNPCDSVWY